MSKSFLGELKCGNVVRTAGLYLVGVLLLMQAAENVVTRIIPDRES